MKNVLILDTETTGLDSFADRAIEVAVILYSVEHATVRAAFSALIAHDRNPAVRINRIPPAALVDADAPDGVWRIVQALAKRADAILAHNAEFNRMYVPQFLRELPWICTQSDVAWPKQSRPGGALVTLALEHDLGVAVARRALADCDLIARLLSRSRELGADLAAMLAQASRPRATFVALETYADQGKAKAAGFKKKTLKRTDRIALTGDVSGITGDRRGIYGDSTGLRGDVSGLTGDVTGIYGDVSRLTGDATGLTGDVSRLRGDVTRLTGDVTGLTGDVTGIFGDVTGIYGDVTGFFGDATAWPRPPLPRPREPA